MRALLDTRSFLWYVSADSRLPTPFRNAIRDPLDRILVAGALQHGLATLTVDDAVRAYSVPLLPSA